MPLFMCRWENGDCSFVAAPTKDAATLYLDEMGNADGSQLTAISDFMAVSYTHLIGIHGNRQRGNLQWECRDYFSIATSPVE